MIRFITEHKDHQVPGPDGGAGLRWGVEPMCEALTKAGIEISSSAYYEWIAKQPTRRQLRDAEVVEIIRAQREDKKTGKFVVTLGSRKLWIRLRGQGHNVARCTVQRIMAEQAGKAPAMAPSTRPRSKTRPMSVTRIGSIATSPCQRRTGCG